MWKLLQGDALDQLKTLDSESVQCVVTSPPYFGLRDYGIEGQIGLESLPSEYVDKLVAVFQEVRRVLRPDGTVWLNLGDSYAANRPGGQPVPTNTRNKQGHYGVAVIPSGLKPKDLIGIPWRVAFALQADGWYLRSDIIWEKPNAMPESVKDRPTKAHEYIFLLTKSERYYYDAEAIKEPATSGKKTSGNKERFVAARGERSRLNTHLGSNVPWENDGQGRNRRSVWSVPTKPYKEAHFATFPPALVEPCILAGCPENKVILDPFAGAGTTLLVAEQLGRHSIGIELNPDYCKLTKKRLA